MRFQCPQCKQWLSAPEEAAGRRAKCKHCQTTLKIPALNSIGSAPQTTPPTSTQQRSAQPTSARLVSPDANHGKATTKKPLADVAKHTQPPPQNDNPFGGLPDVAIPLPSSPNPAFLNSPAQETSLFKALTGIEGSAQDAITKQKLKQAAAISPKVTVTEITKSFRGNISLAASLNTRTACISYCSIKPHDYL